VPESLYREALAAGAAGRVDRGRKGHPIYMLDEDPVPDASLLGMSLPFRVVEPTDPTMSKTAEHLIASLWTSPSGGMKRYGNDLYRNGNPWILCTLWLGQYEAERGEREWARQILDWATARTNEVGLLAEQVDPVSGEPVWVVPLTWSHAMYVLLALSLYRRH
jgi:GH15 family glucan-1,4-alpha-glucosidase